MTGGEVPSEDAPQSRRRNPFATRFTRPGLIPPLDTDGGPLDLLPLLGRLTGGCLAVVGPHGSGKTTLVRALLAAAGGMHRHTRYVQIRSPADVVAAVAAVAATPGGVVGLDGWERLPPGSGLVVAAVAACRGGSVVVTMHADGTLPVLARCTPTARVLAAVVRRLPGHAGFIGSADVDSAFERNHGNIRDALGDLYDRFEERARGGAGRTGISGRDDCDGRTASRIEIQDSGVAFPPRGPGRGT